MPLETHGQELVESMILVAQHQDGLHIHRQQQLRYAMPQVRLTCSKWALDDREPVGQYMMNVLELVDV